MKTSLSYLPESKLYEIHRIAEIIREVVNPENEGLNEGLKSLLEAISSNPGIQSQGSGRPTTQAYQNN